MIFVGNAMPRHMHILYTLVHNVSNPQLSINWFKSLGQISVIELNVLAQMSLACSIAITIFTLHSEHVALQFYRAFNSCGLRSSWWTWRFILWLRCVTVKYDSFLFDLLSPIINQHEKKSGKWKKKFIFQWWTKCHVLQKKNTQPLKYEYKKNKEYVLSKIVLSFCVSGWIKAVRMIIANIVKEIGKKYHVIKKTLFAPDEIQILFILWFFVFEGGFELVIYYF